MTSLHCSASRHSAMQVLCHDIIIMMTMGWWWPGGCLQTGLTSVGPRSWLQLRLSLARTLGAQENMTQNCQHSREERAESQRPHHDGWSPGPVTGGRENHPETVRVQSDRVTNYFCRHRKLFYTAPSKFLWWIGAFTRGSTKMLRYSDRRYQHPCLASTSPSNSWSQIKYSI